MKKILLATGGGDCPGLNAVIRAIVKSAKQDGNYEVYGSKEAFNGLLKEPSDIVKLTNKKVSGIHVKGGTIIKTTNKGNPLSYPVVKPDGSIENIDRSKKLVDKFNALGFDAMINIGGDGSQNISQALYEKGMNIIGVPKTIDNDLSATDITFGFSTAVQVATDSLDKLVTTAESHHRVMIMEVMGREAGWIALYTAIAGGAEICLIPEIPFDIEKILTRIHKRYKKGKGFVNIVIAEGARPKGGEITAAVSKDGDANIKFGGVANTLRKALEDRNCSAQIRTTILGHTQRGGTPIAFDRILGTSMGVKAFEMVKSESYGEMVSFKNNALTSVKLAEAIKEYNYVSADHYLINCAKSIGVSFGD